MTPAERFWPLVDRNGPVPEFNPALGPCWIWLGNRDGDGYGRIRIDWVLHRAHRLAYAIVLGPIPYGLPLDHLCRVHACVNPGHLEAVTSGENTRRSPVVGRLPTQRNQGWGRTHPLGRRSHCKNGHAFDDANTRRRADGSRACRACSREWARRHSPRRAA